MIRLTTFIAVVAWMVPASHRAEWRESWLAELEAVSASHGRRSAGRLARGAFHDALALRREVRRAASARPPLSTMVTWLDVKLAIRMLVRHPGLTAIGVAGMAVGIAIAVGAFGILYTFISPALPLDEGDRIVVLQNRDLETNRLERRTMREFIEWRQTLSSITDLGAFRQVTRNLIADGAQPDTIRVAEMSASGFRVARVDALLGRTLLPSDESPGTAPVLVIGYETWVSRFGSDPAIIGRIVQLGNVPHTIVGVMPDGFAFPVNHAYWTPLRLASQHYEPRTGPELTIFGRLAPGATLETANAELLVHGERAAAASPSTHAQLRPRVLPYTYPFFDIDSPAVAWMVHLVQFLVTLLLVVVCVNVAVLVYARTATRAGEIAIRTALGAGRSRIVMQLFLEALALAAVAAVIGVVLAEAGLKQIHAAMLEGYAGLPFWWEFGLSPGAVLYVVALTVLAAGIVGAVPALKATGRQVTRQLQTLSAGAGSRMQLGRTWTFLIVGQVAFAVALLPAAVYHAWDSLRTGTAHPGFAADEYLRTEMLLDRSHGPVSVGTSDADLRRIFGQRYLELSHRLQSEPQVAGATFSAYVPGEEGTVWIELEGLKSPTEEEAMQASGYAVRAGSGAGHEVRINRVDPQFFKVFSVQTLAGRPFGDADAHPAATTVIVNKSFADRLSGGSNPIGRHVRYVGRTNDARAEDVEFDRWYEIVGVVADFPNATGAQLAPAKIYHAATPSALYPLHLAVRIRGGEPIAFAGRLREIAAAVDPTLQLRDMTTLDERVRREQALLRTVAAVLIGLTAAVSLLASAGIYAMMSFTIAQRRREIGIRTALGADPRQILTSIFSRALAQLAAGALMGGLLAILLEAASDGDMLEGHAMIVLPIVATFMMLVGLVAALGPARRGLRIQPTEALREP